MAIIFFIRNPSCKEIGSSAMGLWADVLLAEVHIITNIDDIVHLVEKNCLVTLQLVGNKLPCNSAVSMKQIAL